MDIEQIITDYIQRSILTTLGDLVVRGVALPERLPGVAVGQVLKSGGVGALPAWGRPAISESGFAIGNGSRNSTGADIITGCGFQPKIILVFGNDAAVGAQGLSVGVEIAGYRHCIALGEGAIGSFLSTVTVLYIRFDAGNHITASVSAYSSDGFTLSFVLTGARTAEYVWLALG